MKYALTYGLLSGFVIIVTMIAGMTLGHHQSFFSSEWFGYLVMLVALTFIFVGVKRYRDGERGGVIRFWSAVAMGRLRCCAIRSCCPRRALRSSASSRTPGTVRCSRSRIAAVRRAP